MWDREHVLRHSEHRQKEYELYTLENLGAAGVIVSSGVSRVIYTLSNRG